MLILRIFAGIWATLISFAILADICRQVRVWKWDREYRKVVGK